MTGVQTCALPIFVNQGSFAMINVSNDGDISYILHLQSFFGGAKIHYFDVNIECGGSERQIIIINWGNEIMWAK